MNIVDCVVLIGFLCVSSTRSSVIVADSNASSSTTASASTATSTVKSREPLPTKGTVNRADPLQAVNDRANKAELSIAVVKTAVNDADTIPSSPSATKSESSSALGNTLAKGNEGGILGIVGSHDAVNLAIVDNSKNETSKNKENASEMPVEIAKILESQDGNNLRLVNVAPDLKHGSSPDMSADNNLPNDKTVKTLPDVGSPASGVVVAIPDGQNLSPDTTKTGLDINNVDPKTGCDIKNRTCVPTREELIAAGVSDVDILQHRMNDSPAIKSNEPLIHLAVDPNENKAGKNVGCNVKNSTCVPTREELIAAGVSNVDLMQHRVTDFGPKPFKLNESLKNKISDTDVNSSDKKADCNVKNSTCVPTRDELIAAGVSNVDLMQHRITDLGPKQLNLNEPLRNKDTNVKTSDKKAGCSVKNSTCVPTESELIAAGVNTDEFVGQYSLDSEKIFLGQFKQNDAKREPTNIPKESIVPGNTDSNPSLQGEMMTGNVSIIQTHTDETTNAIKSATLQQIPVPGPTTKSTAKQEATESLSTTTVVVSKLDLPKKETARVSKDTVNGTTQRLTTSAPGSERTTSSKQTTSEQTTALTTGFQKCPNVVCPGTCKYGRKVNTNGCETCECKFSDDCPRVRAASNLLCLLQVRASQGCVSNADCRWNRICCPGTCGPTCRRASRNRSMLLSMLVD